MRPIEPEPREGSLFITFAKDQPEYMPLPANVQGGKVETKWKMTWKERILALLHGNMYLTILTFNRALQPVRLSAQREEYL